MTYRNLKHKPLVETILEVRWTADPVGIHQELQLDQVAQQFVPGRVDSHYKLFFFNMYQRLIKCGYPLYKELDNARIPDDIAGYMVQHRFAQPDEDWPMVQIGPGILTLNETKKYDWQHFEKRAIELIGYIYELHPSPQSIRIQSLSLRYINAIEFDYSTEDIYDFLKNLKLSISFDDKLFTDKTISKIPNNFVNNATFQVEKPNGLLYSNLRNGLSNDVPAIIWELMLLSTASEISHMPEYFGEWLTSSHLTIDKWFRTAIEGELERRFKGE